MADDSSTRVVGQASCLSGEAPRTSLAPDASRLLHRTGGTPVPLRTDLAAPIVRWLLILACCLLPAPLFAQGNALWRDQSIYQIFTDRFNDGDPSNNNASGSYNARASGIQARKIADVYSDTDGIPDWWRLAYFNHATGEANDLSRAADDADGDGASNWHEFLAGTDPLNPASIFAIAGLDLSSGSNVLVECLVASNRTYQLLWQDDPTGGSWMTTGAPVAAVSNAVTLVDPSGPTNAARFYRVEIQ